MRSKPAPEKAEQLSPPLAPGLPVDAHDEELIDEALTETFPASDPIAVPLPDDVARRRKARPRKR
jgi:hypothetical protein